MNVSKNCFFLVSLFVISLPLSGCNQENQKLQTENAALRSKLQTLETELAKQPRELDRKAAEEILNRYLSAPSEKYIEFTESGLELAKTDSVISENPGSNSTDVMAHPWKLSQKGLMIFGSIVSEGDMKISRTHNKIKSKTSEKVVSIEGITDAPYPGTKVVQFTTKYVLPPDAKQEIFKYIYSGERKETLFRRYDDGWRVENNNRF